MASSDEKRAEVQAGQADPDKLTKAQEQVAEQERVTGHEPENTPGSDAYKEKYGGKEPVLQADENATYS